MLRGPGDLTQPESLLVGEVDTTVLLNVATAHGRFARGVKSVSLAILASEGTLPEVASIAGLALYDTREEALA